ncbi:MAG: hypothetical protein E6Q36_08825 [Chryseobacterium sp.]|nr:MAG: hypothetical protein E6Q36_08825 [Chryseobacterium sp.]
MSIRINLLPEARMLRLKNKAKKKTYATLAGLVGGITLATIIVFGMLQVFLLSTYAVNENRIKALTKEVNVNRDMEQSAATLQGNLASFYTLNANRTYASRIFSNLFKTIPGNITINSFQIDDQDKVTISGTADSFADVSKFAESLKQYNVDFLPQKDLERLPIFKDVTITSVSKDTNSGKVNYSLTFNVDKELIKKQKSES